MYVSILCVLSSSICCIVKTKGRFFQLFALHKLLPLWSVCICFIYRCFMDSLSCFFLIAINPYMCLIFTFYYSDLAPSKGRWKQPGLGPFLPFQPTPDDLAPEPFTVPSNDDPLSSGQRTWLIQPTAGLLPCWRDYGRASIAYRRTDERDTRTRQRHIFRDDQLAICQAGSRSPPSSPHVPWIRTVPSP